MKSTGPSISDSLGMGVGLSVAGPIAGAVFCLVRGGGSAEIGEEGFAGRTEDNGALL